MRTTITSGLLWLFVFLLPVQLGSFFFQDFSFVNGVRVDYLAPALYLTDLVFLALLFAVPNCLYRSAEKPSTKSQGTNLSLALIIVLSGINISLSLEPVLALYGWLKFAQMYLVYRIFQHFEKSSKVAIYSALCAGAVIQLTLAMGQFIEKEALQGVFYYLGERYFTINTPGIAKASFLGEPILRPYGSFSHPNSMGGFYALTLAFALTTKGHIILKPLLILLSATLVLLSFSKGAILAALAAVIIYLSKEYRTSIDPCRLCTIGKLFIAVVVGAFFMLPLSDPQSFDKRIFLLKQSIDVIMQFPFFGTGFKNSLLAHAEFSSPFAYFFLQPVHNIFMLFIEQSGLIIATITAGALFKLLRKLPITILAVLVITGMVDHYWLTLQQNMLLAPTLLGFFTTRTAHISRTAHTSRTAQSEKSDM